ncbi:MAG: inorganic diphosphatase [Clostridia bacterium]|nr:inorganic diphosphatase [Clostridia bacterium]
MNPWHDISPERVNETQFLACVEISKGGKNKYELDKQTGMLKLDRVLYTSTHYPANYGLIPLTYADDNDPLDVLILCQEALVPLCLLDCRPIGVMTMIDGTEMDFKIIAVPVGDPSMAEYKDVEELPQHLVHEMKHFFEVYKDLENKSTVVKGFEGAASARRIIAQARAMYREKFGK